MAYRECPNHGWLHTDEYTVNEAGDTICPVCEMSTSGYYDDVKTRMKFGDIGGPTHKMRPEWRKAHFMHMVRADHVETSMTEEDVHERFPNVEVPE